MNSTSLDAELNAPRRVLVTGSAGFIGFHVAMRMLASGHTVVGIDALTDYYDVGLKKSRLEILQGHARYQHHSFRIEDHDRLHEVFTDSLPDIVIHLAAQAGVRYALEVPRSYVESNIVGTFNILEASRMTPPRHLLIASTSSVYGANRRVPYTETQRTDHPMSFYAATKKATEDMAHAYANLYAVPTTCFRFFTVYGPWGRPDMALFKFVEATFTGEPISLHGSGAMLRDYTYVEDLVEAIQRLANCVPHHSPGSANDSLSPVACYRAVNIGGGAPMPTTDLVREVERATGRVLKVVNVPAVPGEVPITHADPGLLYELTNFKPETSLRVGVSKFVDWYSDYYGTR